MTRSKASKGSASKRSKSSAVKSNSRDGSASQQRRAPVDSFWNEYRRHIKEGGLSSGYGPADHRFQELKKQFGILSAERDRQDEASSFMLPSGSGASDSEQCGSKPRPDAYWVMPREVQYALTKYFTEINSKPGASDRDAILLVLQQLDASITLSKVTRWFQNRRAYVKRCKG